MEVSNTGNELDVRHYLRVLQRRKFTIIVVTALCTAVSAYLAFSETPVYEAQATVLLQRQTPAVTEGPNQRVDPEVIRSIETLFFQSEQVKAEARERLGYSSRARVKTDEQGVEMTVTARSTDPERAAQTADTFAETYLDLRLESTLADYTASAEVIQRQLDALAGQIEQKEEEIRQLRPLVPEDERDDALAPLEDERDALVAQRGVFQQRLDSLNVSADLADSSGPIIVQTASVPGRPVSQQPLRDVGSGAFVGLLLGIALAFLRDFLDDSIRSKDDLQRASQGLPVLAAVPRLRDWKNLDETHIVSMEARNSPATEAYRSLRTSIQFALLDESIASLQVTSPRARDGKTTTTTNLGVVFARAGQRVVVVDCDLRRPRLHQFFGLSNEIGFTSVLLGEVELSQAMQKVPGEPSLLILPSGPCPQDPSELLSTRKARDVLEALEAASDLVIVDSPPVLPVTDALVLSDITDALVLVTKAGTTKKREAAAAVESIVQVGGPLIGTVLNGLSDEGGGYGYGYGYGYEADDEAPERSPRGRRDRQGDEGRQTDAPTEAGAPG